MSAGKKRTGMPRRTEEFDFSAPQSSQKKTAQRASRIAQPVRKLSKASLGHGAGENRRSASSDRFNLQPPAVQQTPGTARKTGPHTRSNSVTPARRTPMRSCENVSVPSTVEKDKPPLENREWMNAQCERICDYLETIPDLPREFVERRNLKALSMKQFLVIMTHLFRKIGGSRYKLGNNFIDDIMKTMAELEYPYSISKSMLKTPNVPHSINHIIVMIGWLIQLAPQVNQKLEPLQRDVELLEGFPTKDYQEFFFEKTREGFSLWNLKKEEEFEAVVEELTDKLVAARTDGLSQQQVWKRISELEQELQGMTNQSIQQGREHSMDDMARGIHEQHELKKKLDEELRVLSKLTGKEEEDYYKRQEEYYAHVKKMEQLKQEIESQQLAAYERDELLTAMAANKNLLKAKRIAVSNLEQTSYDYQIEVSRLIKQKFNLISNLNTKLHQFADSLKPLIDFSAPTVDLKTEDYAGLQKQLQTIKTQLTHVISQQSSLYSTLNDEKSKLEHQLSDIQIQHTFAEKSLQELSARYEELLKQREVIVNQLSDISVENSQSKQRKEQERVQMDKDIAQLEEQCEQNKKAVVKLAQDKQLLMVEKLEKCHQYLNEKKRVKALLTEQLQDIEAVMAAVERELNQEGD